MDKANTYIAQYLGSDAQTLSIPETVKKIRTNAFKGKTSLISITCPSTPQLEFIESYAFYGCTKLSTIFPFPSIKSIDKNPFYRCSERIQFGQNLYSIGEYCFSEVSNLQSVEFTSRVSLIIENNAFSLCPKITKILFNNEMSISIGDYCFMGLPGLSELFIPSTVTSAGSYCFSSCAMNNVTFESNTFTPGFLPVGIFSNCTSLSDFSIPDNVNSLGGHCLEMTSIKNVNIPESVVDLGSQCFRSCSILGTVNITNTSRLTNIGYGVFEGCSKFSRIIPFRSQNFVVDYGAVYAASLDKMIIYPPASPSNFCFCVQCEDYC